MLSSFSQIFNSSSIQVNRKYQFKPKFIPKSNVVVRNKFKRFKRDSNIFQGILDFLATPIQHWALQYQKSLHTYALHEWIYNEIISFSTTFKQKLSAAEKQNLMVQQLITQIRMQNAMSLPNFRKPKISLHNAFVLMTQYKIMEKIVYDLNTQQLQMMIDGLSFIYFHGVGKVQNIGQVLSEQQIISGIGGWGTIDQLTCCIHFITTHTKLYKTYPQKQKYSLMKEIQILKMPNFIRVYDCLQQNKKIDNIVNSIPMFMQFLQIFIKHKNNSIAGCQFVMNVKWLSSLGFRIIQIIQYNINKLIFLNLDTKQDLSAQQLEIISQLQNLNQKNEKQESQIVVKLTQKALLLRQTQGSINLRVLFSYAYHHLYTVNFMIKLAKKVIQLSKAHYKVYKQTCQNVCKFLHKLFQCVFKYQFVIPQTSILQICQIIKLISQQCQYLFGEQELQVKGFDYLYSNQINSIQLRQFSRTLQASRRFGYYLNKQPRPHLVSADDTFSEQIRQDFNVSLDIKQDSMFYFVLSSIYNMNLDYLHIIFTVLKYADKRYLQNLQFYFIKNQLLHFLIEEEHEIQLKDKKNIKIMFNTIAYLIKGNLVAYAITNHIIVEQFDQEKSRSYFLQDLKKHFSESKQLLKIVLSDAITVNSKNTQPQLRFQPEILQRLLYSSSQEIKKDPKTSSKHEIWISYVSNVILLDLFTYKKKVQQIQRKKSKSNIASYINLIQIYEENAIKNNKNERYNFQQQIYDWITLILLLHIDFAQSKKFQEYDEQMLIAQFVMTYLSTILSQAIKWKYKNQSQRMLEFMKMLEDWQNHYTNLILNAQNNQDLLQKQYGGCINFLFLKRWNKKILKSINMYLLTMEQYNKERRMMRKSLQKVKRSLEKIRSLKNIRLA